VAVADVVTRQRAAGLDVISDGEQSKPGFFGYIGERLSGLEPRPGRDPLAGRVGRGSGAGARMRAGLQAKKAVRRAASSSGASSAMWWPQSTGWPRRRSPAQSRQMASGSP